MENFLASLPEEMYEQIRFKHFHSVDQLKNYLRRIKKRKRPKRRSSKTKRNNDTFIKPKCNHCKKIGHLEDTCWKKYPKLAPKSNKVQIVEDNIHHKEQR